MNPQYHLRSSRIARHWNDKPLRWKDQGYHLEEHEYDEDVNRWFDIGRPRLSHHGSVPLRFR